jgi:hypothetical protein
MVDQKDTPDNKTRLSNHDREIILAHFEKGPDSKSVAPGCVDGRKPNSERDLYYQALGGSMNICVLAYVLRDRAEGVSFNDSIQKTLQYLLALGYSTGVHDAENTHGASCGCGFCEKLGQIIAKLQHEATAGDIWKRIVEARPDLEQSTPTWERVLGNVRRIDATKDFIQGSDILTICEVGGSSKQVLQGEHAEKAAIVNLRASETLNVSSLVDDGMQAFNLDVPYVLELASAVNLDESDSLLLTLGLYVATHDVLVTDTGKEPLPIIVRE